MKRRRQQLESGQGFTEYALILALVSIASIFVLNALFGVMQDNFVTVLCEMRDLGRGETNCNFDNGQIVEEDLTDDPQAPTAVINYTCDTSGNCVFDPSSSYDDNNTPIDTSDDGTITQYEFLFSPNTVVSNTTGAAVAHTFATSPAYTILRVTDNEDLTGTATVLVEFSPTNQAPKVDYYLTTTGGVGATYTFNPTLTSAGTSDGGQSATRDPDGSLSEVKWEIYNTATNGRVRLERYQTNPTQNFNHTFTQAGTFRIVVTATDSESPAQSTALNRYINVTGTGLNTPPTVSRLGIIDDDGNFCGSGTCYCSKDGVTPTPSNAVATCRVVAEISDDDPLSNGNIQFTVSPVNGAATQTISADTSLGATISVGGNNYYYRDFVLDVDESGNTHNISVSVFDGTNTINSSATPDIVMNQAPSVSAIAKVSGSGETITVEASATDADSDNLRFRWRYDDDATGGVETNGKVETLPSNPTTPVTSQDTYTFTFSTTLAREIELEVFDGVVATTVTTSLPLNNDAPVMQSISVNKTSDPLVQFTATATDTEDGIPTTYCWSFGSTSLDSDKTTTQNGTCINDDTPIVGYCATGTYPVSVYAKDSAGQVSNTLTLTPPLAINNANAASGCSSGSSGASATAALSVNCNFSGFDCEVSNTSTGNVVPSTIEYFANGSAVPFATGAGPVTYDGSNTNPVTFRIEFEDSNGNPYFAQVKKAPQGIWIENTLSSTVKNGNTVNGTITLYKQSDTSADGQPITGIEGASITVSIQRFKQGGASDGTASPACTFTAGTPSVCNWSYTPPGSTKSIAYTITLNTTPTYPIDTSEPFFPTTGTFTGF